MDENKTFGYENDSWENNAVEQPYGQSQGQDTQQPYGQTYGQANQQPYGQSYGQANQQPYGQPYGQANQQTYGQSNYNSMVPPLDNNGQPLKNTFAMKLTFSILEILCCCGCNVITMILGIISCVFTTQANTAYKEGRWNEYKEKTKTSSILLWVGLGVAVVYLIINIVAGVMNGTDLLSAFEEGYEAGYSAVAGNDDADYDYDYDYADDEDDAEASGTETETETETETVEETEAAEPLEVVAGEGFTDPVITVNGVAIALPLTYAELEELGFSISDDDKDYVLNDGEYSYNYMYDATGLECGTVYIANLTEEAIEQQDGVVFGVSVDSYNLEDGVTFSLSNGINENATKDDLFTAFGDPDYAYDSNELGEEDDDDSYDYDSQRYQWYSHNEEYYDSSYNSLSISYWDGELDEIDMRYLGWD